MNNEVFEITAEKYPVILDIRYASTNNVFDKVMYSDNRCYLNISMQEKFEEAVALAQEQGLMLKIFDTSRPLKVQQYMYDKFPGEFVSDPKTGSIPHCRGIAIDLTLADANSNELNMGSDFDEFSELAFHSYENLDQEILDNRQLLLKIMTKAGWDFYDKEWWHYQDFNPRDTAILDLEGFSAV